MNVCVYMSHTYIEINIFSMDSVIEHKIKVFKINWEN